MSKFTAIDLFCGAGGLSLGFRKAGFEIFLGIDNNLQAIETFKRNHKEAGVIKDDVKKIVRNFSSTIEKKIGKSDIDAVIGGPMCKGFSLANVQTRTPDNRYNNLYTYFAKFIENFKPLFFVMENVPGILSIDNGKFKNKIIRRFRKIGYFIEEPYILDAADFGVPQKRKRVFFIGFLDAGIELNFKPNGSKKVTVAEAISDLPKLPVGGGGVNSMLYTNGFNSNYQKKMRGKCKIVFNHVSTKSRDHIIERFKKIKQGENWKSVKSMLNYKKVENTHSMIYKRLKWTDPAVTIANFRKSMLIHPRQNRLLSVREAARLQSFPDSYVFEGSLSSMQQQVADAVPPLLAQAVANEISKNLK